MVTVIQIGIRHCGKWLRVHAKEQSSDTVLVQETLMFLGLGPTSIPHFPSPSYSCPFFWQHFIGLETDLFLSHGEALDLSLGTHCCGDSWGAEKGPVRCRHKVANKKTTTQ